METIDDRMDALLRELQAPVPDEGFTITVMAALPRRTASSAKARRWCFAGTAAAGGLLTTLFGASLDRASEFAFIGGTTSLLVPILLLAGLAVPLAWALYSD